MSKILQHPFIWLKEISIQNNLLTTSYSLSFGFISMSRFMKNKNRVWKIFGLGKMKFQNLQYIIVWRSFLTSSQTPGIVETKTDRQDFDEFHDNNRLCTLKNDDYVDFFVFCQKLFEFFFHAEISTRTEYSRFSEYSEVSRCVKMSKLFQHPFI